MSEISSSSSRADLLIESITDYAIYMLDRDGIIASWNPGAEHLKGYAKEDVLGTHFSRFYTEEDRAAGRPDSALQEAVEHGRFEAEGWRAKTGLASGQVLWSIQSGMPRVIILGSPRLRATFQNGDELRKLYAKVKSGSVC